MNEECREFQGKLILHVFFLSESSWWVRVLWLRGVNDTSSFSDNRNYFKDVYFSTFPMLSAAAFKKQPAEWEKGVQSLPTLNATSVL